MRYIVTTVYVETHMVDTPDDEVDSEQDVRENEWLRAHGIGTAGHYHLDGTRSYVRSIDVVQAL